LGRLDDAVLATFYATARVVCLPSSEEGYGLTIAEATACGAPIIAADLPVYGETIGAGGHYFPLNRWDICGKLLIEAFNGHLPAASLSQTFVGTWSESAAQIASALADIVQRRNGSCSTQPCLVDQ
jgi:glycosyltransferase involved in cell wall biosynthesis